MTGGTRRLETVADLPGVIVTPEAVVIDLQTGGLATRLMSGLIDAAVRVAIVMVVAIGVAIVRVGVGFERSVVAFTIFFAIIGYPIVTEVWWRGRTVGKLATGLRVVTTEGAPIRFRHAALRSMGGVADLLLPPGGITGLLFVWGTPRNQRIGDLLAGTIVVRNATIEEPSAAFWFPIPTGYEQYAEQLDPTAMTSQLYLVVRSFLLRIHEFGASGRATVAQALADKVGERIGHPREPQVHPEAFLLCAVARYQRRARALDPTAAGSVPLGPPGVLPGAR